MVHFDLHEFSHVFSQFENCLIMYKVRVNKDEISKNLMSISKRGVRQDFFRLLLVNSSIFAQYDDPSSYEVIYGV